MTNPINNQSENLLKNSSKGHVSFSPLLSSIRFYQKWISPMTGANCRFTPTCSSYMFDAISQHGHMKGVFLGTKRICKCHPWHEGGYDPVPEKKILPERSGNS